MFGRAGIEVGATGYMDFVGMVLAIRTLEGGLGRIGQMWME